MATAANPFFVNAGSTADQKAADYSRLLSSGMSDQNIRSAATNFFGPQTDADWSYLQNLAQQGAAPAPGASSVPYQSALIESLRAASPGFGSNNPGVTMLPNPANSTLTINFLRGPRTGLINNPPALPPPAPAPGPSPAPPPPVIGPGGPGNPPVIGPGPVVPPVPFFPRNDDFVGPPAPDFVGPMPDDFVGPPAPDDDAAQTFPVPDSAPPDARDLPPLDEPAQPIPVPDTSPWEPVDLPPADDFVGPPAPEDDITVPDYTEDLWPPVEADPVDPPQGEIEVGPPGDSQPARDVIDEIGDITEVGDPLDELGDIDLPDPVIEPPPFVPPSNDDFVGPLPFFPGEDDFVGPMPDDFVGPPAPDYDEIPEGEIEVSPPGSSQPARDAIDEIGDITEVGDPLDELGEIDLPEPVIEPPFIPPVGGDDFVGPMPDFSSEGDFVGPMPDDFVGPSAPEYDEIPEGQIDVVAPGSSQPARDAIDQIGDITEVGDPLDELGDIELSDFVIDPPSVPSAGDDFVGPMPDDFVGPMPDDLADAPATVPDYTNDLWGPDQSLSDQDLLEMTLFDLMAQELLTGGGGGGGPMNNMNILAYE